MRTIKNIPIKKATIWVASILFFILVAVTYASQTADTKPIISSNKVPLIPHKIIFGNPEKTNPKISPDGSKVTFLAPSKGVLNIYLANGTDISHAKQVTKEYQRDIREYFWSYNKDHLFYLQDQNGDENFHLHRVNCKTGKIKDLTPFSKTRVFFVKMSSQFPDKVVIGINNRDPKWADVYYLNIITGKLTLIEKNNCFDGFVVDENLKLRLASKPTDGNSSEYYSKKNQGNWELYEKVTFADEMTTKFLCFNKDGTIVYKQDSQDRDKAALYTVDVATKKKRLLAENTQADCDDLLLHPTKLTPQAFSYEYTKKEWEVLDQNIAKDFTYLKNNHIESFEVVDRSLADDKWIIRYYSDVKPSHYYLYERDIKTNKPVRLTFLFTSKPLLANQPLVPMQPIIIKSRDGYDLVSYLTLPPKELQPNNQEKELPLVLLVHGGPWGRDSWGIDGHHQWLANRGYAVLSVNYRGSFGFGKTFINAGNKEWGGKMHDDLIDAIDWAIKEKIANPKKIAIMGYSYGGYAALGGLTFTPDTFCCGISIVGISNLLTFMKTMPPYWQPEITILKKRVGDIDTEDGRKLLTKRSPLTYADKIKKPLLIMQGEHDPRVNKAESDQIVNLMKEKNIPVTYVLYHDEGHGFVREPNVISSFAIMEQFLASNLGGRFEELKEDELKKANFSILAGQDLIRGLKKENSDFSPTEEL